MRPLGDGRRNSGFALRGGKEGGRAAPPRTVRVSSLQSEPRAEGAARSGDWGEAVMRKDAGPVRAQPGQGVLPGLRCRSAQLKLAGGSV